MIDEFEVECRRHQQNETSWCTIQGMVYKYLFIESWLIIFQDDPVQTPTVTQSLLPGNT